ncbi:MAG: HVO_0234 family beta-propeller protein, partial [Halobacteriota archaeon]
GDGVYAVTADGVFLANVGDGWRHRSLGLSGVSGVSGIAVV